MAQDHFTEGVGTLSTVTPAVNGVPSVDYHPSPRETAASAAPSLSAHIRASGSSRPREHRDGSSKHKTRGGTDDADPDPEPPGESPRRLCEVCGSDISWRSPRAMTCGGYCRLKKHRQGKRKHRRSALPTESWAESPYRLFRPGEPGGLSEREELAARAAEGCRCNGGPVARSVAGVRYVRDDSYMLDTSGWCIKCGHERRQGVDDDRLRVWGRMRETERRRPGRSDIRSRAFWRDDPKPCEEVVA